MGAAYYISSGMNCYRASQARSRLNNSLTIGNNGPRRTSCPTPRTKQPPKVVQHQGLANALAAAARFNDDCENGISMTEFRVALGAIQVTDKNLPEVKLALTNALKNPGQWGWQAQQLATKLAGAATAKDFVALQQFDLAQGLDAAAESKAGITKPELGSLLKNCFADGQGLSPARRGLIQQAVLAGKFARRSTAALAQDLASGRMNHAQAGAIFGFSGR